MKSNIIIFSISQVVILIFIWLIYGQWSLLGYINVSFFVSGLLLLIGGIVFIIRTGSFDFFMKSMQKVLARKGQREALESMRVPSEAMSVRSAWFFMAGLPSFVLMLLALVLYYL
ncbi:DUF3899 domain-containing protein [Mammaliicoccus sciuri]|uniref:DUF3899 domain-containing protein n=2 Tax=Sporosarcina newyorkensis TaxID=759851 RepID=A0A1T4YVV1_9BACL|nr:MULTISPECIES: DUF3899 domain-containing protein [Sporosarcina]MBY0223593.1 DUF3899 domain-containing protein [Sporosarcina aquimarina]SKB05431.1 protein of unknown function [Sporosarcina newyorkensis]